MLSLHKNLALLLICPWECAAAKRLLHALSAQEPCPANLLLTCPWDYAAAKDRCILSLHKNLALLLICPWDCAAARRPLNSALELDLDFERQIRPPPQATEEATASLEDLIKYAFRHCFLCRPLQSLLLAQQTSCLCCAVLRTSSSMYGISRRKTTAILFGPLAERNIVGSE